MTVKRTSRSVAASRREMDQVTTLASTHEDAIIEGLTALLAPKLEEGEEMPNMRLILFLLVRHVQSLHWKLITGDQGRMEEATDHIQARTALEDAEQVVRSRVRFVRTAVETSYGQAGLDCIPFNAAEAKTVDGLIDQTEYMIQRLPDLADRKPLLPPGEGESAIGLAPPPDILADSLRSRLRALHVARQVYLEELQQRRAAELRQRDFLGKFESDVRDVREILKRLCSLAGHEELANQFKARRRASRTTAVDQDPPTDTNEMEDPPTTENIL